jgi:hypothetical protein
MKNRITAAGAIVMTLFCVTFAPTGRGADASAALPPLNLTIKDLTPKFLTFYNEATKDKASPDKRWDLWKKDYDFAAVPPTPEGEEIAKKLLNDAWPRYPAVLDRIREGVAGLTPDPHAATRSIAELLRPETPVNVTLLEYVGGFEENAFTAAQGGKIMTAIPIEGDPNRRVLLMTHELTHGGAHQHGQLFRRLDSHDRDDGADGRVGNARDAEIGSGSTRSCLRRRATRLVCRSN